MATLLKTPVTREVVSGGVAYIITVTHAGVMIREKGRRITYGPVAWGHVFMQGAKLAAASLIHERDTAREERGGKKRRHHVTRGLLSTRAW